MCVTSHKELDMFKSFAKSSTLASLLALTTMSASAVPIVFDRGLPTANLNNGAGSSRSNVAWGEAQQTPAAYVGDDFTLGTGNWAINTVRIWAVVGPTPATASIIADRFSSLTLFGGSGSTLTNLMTGNTVGNGTTNPNITVSQVQYANNTNYDSFGSGRNIFEIEFTNLNWNVAGGVLQHFSVAGVDNPSDATFFPFFMHASNAGFGGAPAAGADGLYSEFVDNGSGGLLLTGSVNSGLPNNGWDKSSDINVQVEASQVPEPASMALLGAAFLGLAASRRKRAAKR